MNIKQGYKQTEIGIIPEDWEVNSLIKVLSKIIDNRGKTPPYSKDSGIELIESASISFVNQYPDYSKVNKFVSKSTYDFWFRGHPVKHDILISTVGEYSGSTAIINENRGTIAQNLIALRINELNPNYVFYWTKSNSFKKQLDQVMMNQAQPSLRVPWLLNFQLIYPLKLQEQTAIATALSDIDALIGELDKLIAKKQGIKQATMQQLLTGKKRLAGFSGEWEVTNLGAVCNESMQNGVFFKPSNKGFGIKIINVGDLYKASPIDLNLLELFNANNSEKERFSVRDGDLFFTRSSVVPSGIAHCNMYQSNKDESVVFDSHVIRVRPNKQKVISLFLFRFCISSIARNYLISHAKTGTMTTIDQSVLAKCPVHVPSLKEQTAIANILSDMDAEINQLEGRRAKMGELKQGMMQELLTGRIRLTGGRYL